MVRLLFQEFEERLQNFYVMSVNDRRLGKAQCTRFCLTIVVVDMSLSFVTQDIKSQA